MGDTSKIKWTDSTFNPWIGCTNVSPGCDNCYAESMNAYRGWSEWGPRGKRRRTSDSNWRNPIKWDRKASQENRRQRVFCASLADAFDNKAPEEWRADLFKLIKRTSNLDWQLLTKRPQNIARFLPNDWGEGYANVWLGITAEDQARYEQRWPILAAIPSVIRFVSYEPAIGPLNIEVFDNYPDWLISGGESGAGQKTRVMDPMWARAVRDQCLMRKIAFFHTQWGDYRSNPAVFEQSTDKRRAEQYDPKTNGKGGALLDGRLWREFPARACQVLIEPF